MSEIPHIQRMIKLLLNLSSGIKYTSDNLINRYGISKRTFHRDILTLQNAGFPVEQEHGRYFINKLESPLKALHELPYFSEEEAWILQRAIHSIDENNQLKMNLVEKLYALYKFGKVAEVIVRKEQSENISNLTRAINHRQVAVLHNYRSANSGTIENRTVEPFDFTHNYISVWAYDTETGTNKVFKTSRIGKVSLTGKPQQHISMHRSLPLDVFRISSEEQIPVKLRLSLRAYNLLLEEYPLAEKYLSRTDDNNWMFEAPVSGFDGVGRFVMGLCDEIDVLSPDAFKTYLKEKIRNMNNYLAE
jgi:predicted DNA-binding transcriptional regulator YafY